mmetsp:Transcript_42867/g.69225  ORF Transcript_42867/g.69225 Transcript_42867/m.69225 type:complete len:92 (+) Transcript_42867:858-1133(+)
MRPRTLKELLRMRSQQQMPLLRPPIDAGLVPRVWAETRWTAKTPSGAGASLRQLCKLSRIRVWPARVSNHPGHQTNVIPSSLSDIQDICPS